jgi:hypothetical protein
MRMVVWWNQVQLLLGSNSVLAAINSYYLRRERLQRFDLANAACCHGKQSEVL